MDQRLVQLYQSEINWAVTTFFDEGFTALLGDELNGWKAQDTFSCLDDAIAFIWKQARLFYPNADCFRR